MEKVKFQNSRGLELVGEFRKSDSDIGIVMSHGFTGDKHEWGYFDKVAEELNDAGFNVLAFDFSGSGESNKSSITAEKEIDDLNSAIEYVLSKSINKVGLYGHSLGGYISLKNYRPEVKAIVLTAPVTDKKDLSKSNLTWCIFAKGMGKVPSIGYLKNKKQLMWINTDIVDEMKNVKQKELLSRINCPVLIIHGNKDDVVNLQDSKNAVEKLNDAKLEVIEGLDHSFDSHLDEVVSSSVNWFNSHLQ